MSLKIYRLGINTNYNRYVINSEHLRVLNSRRIDEEMAYPF